MMEFEVAFVLERFPYVAEVLALDRSPDASFAVGLRPYSIACLVEAHYALLAVTSHETTGRVVYFDADQGRPVWVAQRARTIRVPASARDRVRQRVEERAAESARVWRLEEEAIERARMERELGKIEPGEGEWISASLQSGQFEVVRDPFPSDVLPRARVLVVDEDAEVGEPLRVLGELEVVHVCDGWEAVERLTSEKYDLAICSMKETGELNGRTIYKLVKGQKPAMAARIVLLANASAIEALGPASSSERVLAAPLDPDAVRALLARWRSAT